MCPNKAERPIFVKHGRHELRERGRGSCRIRGRGASWDEAPTKDVCGKRRCFQLHDLFACFRLCTHIDQFTTRSPVKSACEYER
jgi:hypothetical protein